jgi:hypothetical protein
MQPGTATPQATTDRLPLRTASTPRTTATSRPVTATRPTSSGSSPTWPGPTDTTPVTDRPDGLDDSLPQRVARAVRDSRRRITDGRAYLTRRDD